MIAKRPILFACLIILSLASCRTVDPEATSGDYDLSSLAIFQQTDEPLICTTHESNLGRSPQNKFSDEYEDLFSSYLRRPDEPADWGQIDVREKYHPFVKDAVAAVPTALSSWYFRLGGILRLVRDVETQCADDSVSLNIPIIGQEGKVAGCLITQNNAPEQLPRMLVGVRDELLELETYSGDAEIKLREDLANISQGFALLFAFITTELDGGQLEGGDLRAQLGSGDEELKHAKAVIASKFVQDFRRAQAAQQGSVWLPEFYEQLLAGTRVLEFEGFDNEAQHVAFILSQMDNNNVWMFVNSVFAQIVDTDLCSQQTRDLMYADGAFFKETGAYYAFSVKPYVLSHGVGISLTENARFPRLRATLLAPYAVARYFHQNRPVRTYFQKHKPVRRFLVNVRAIGQRILRRPAQTAQRPVLFPGNRCWRVRRGLCR